MLIVGVFNIFYDPIENIFYNPCGIRINNIYKLITPNDLFLFRQNHNKSIFMMKNSSNVLCKIIIDK